MRRGFWNGLLTGGVVGAVVGLFVAPQLKPDTRRTLKKRGDMMQNKTTRVIKGVRNTVKGLMK